jgi:hypothetical protein
MRKTTSFADAVAALALTGVSVTGALAGSADAPAIMPSPWIVYRVGRDDRDICP